MVKKKILFNGNNEKWFNTIYRKDSGCSSSFIFPDNWTSEALDALNHAFNSARSYKSRMAVFVYENPDMFVFNSIKDNLRGLDSAVWYQCHNPLFRTVQKRDSRIKVYTQGEMERFLEDYSSKERYPVHQAYLRNMLSQL